MVDYAFQPLFEKMKDHTLYRKIDGGPGVGDSANLVTVEKVGAREFLVVKPEALTRLAAEAFDDVSHLLRASHLHGLSEILKDPNASDNDRFVALELLRNAVISAERVFPSCQDTGTPIVYAKRGDRVLVEGDDEDALSRGIFETYQKKNLRYSQLAPLSMYDEKNTGTNLPAQVDILASKGDSYEFLFIAKGGGSANKTYLYQKTKSLLNPASMETFVREAISTLGTAACPPYHLAFVIGGTSAETVTKTVKLASCHYLDHLPTSGNASGRAWRDLEMEKNIEKWARETGIGAQFGGKYFVHDVRVIRLPRHGASCPVAMGVSCSADRQMKGKITREGLFLEQLEENPAHFLPGDVKGAVAGAGGAATEAVRVDLNRPMEELRATLAQLPVSTRVMLSGPLIVARDIAHAKIAERVRGGGAMPDYMKKFPVYYAGPAKTPEGHASGSFGPTTSERMDPYVPEFQALGASLVMLGKGNRTPQVTASCKAHGGFYLGSIGGPAARLGRDCIRSVNVLDFPELGMEAVWKIEVEDFPAFVIVDDKGNDFFAKYKKS
ncbi:MAG: fumarate hydratase [Silvanigrellales bacterium]|nr:fumarate hydratase [Silvanigrellales bacterium]